MADKSEAVHSHTHKSLLSLKAFAKISTGALMGIYSFIVDDLDFPRSAFQITSQNAKFERKDDVCSSCDFDKE